jgi:phosphoribosylglycinamide formyltransferase 1
MKKIAVFASGTGSNFQAIIDAVKDGQLKIEISLLVCDKPSALAIVRAQKEDIPVFVFQPKDYKDKADYETEILAKLEDKQIEFIALAGYMRLIGPTILSKFEGNIINIHPSLLPNFPGKDAIGQAIEAGVDRTGVTIHYVDAGMDTGKVIAQKATDIVPGESKESLQQKIQKIEHQLYPEVLKQILHSESVK